MHELSCDLKLGAGVQEALKHIIWLGGASGAGKSTIAQRLAKKHGLTVYDTDERMNDHVDRAAGRKDCSYLDAFLAMTMDQRWVERSADEMLQSFHWYRGEAFDLIVNDLMEMPRDRPIIAEGFRLLPRLVQRHIRENNQALWLIPTPDIRERAFEVRGTKWDIANQTSNPPVALDNLLRRDALFGQQLEQDLNHLGLPYVKVNGRRTERQLAEEVARHFML